MVAGAPATKYMPQFAKRVACMKPEATCPFQGVCLHIDLSQYHLHHYATPKLMLKLGRDFGDVHKWCIVNNRWFPNRERSLFGDWGYPNLWTMPTMPNIFSARLQNACCSGKKRVSPWAISMCEIDSCPRSATAIFTLPCFLEAGPH